MLNLQQQYIFEIPYNFDKKLVDIFYNLSINNIYSFYIPPLKEDYIAIPRNDYKENYYELSYNNYISHINNIYLKYPNKMSLLLQNRKIIMDKAVIEKYIDMGFTKFIVGSIDQAKEIKNNFPFCEITGSIAFHFNNSMNNIEELIKYFKYFVLDFSYNHDLNKIKKLPTQFQYILLINSFCHNQCYGNQHWFKTPQEEYNCPGLYLRDYKDFSKTTLIRPMDLEIFKPYISIYKLQDRGWSTKTILADFLLYNTNFSIYPNIQLDEQLYLK